MKNVLPLPDLISDTRGSTDDMNMSMGLKVGSSSDISKNPMKISQIEEGGMSERFKTSNFNSLLEISAVSSPTMDKKLLTNGFFTVVSNDPFSELIMNYTSSSFSHGGVFIRSNDIYTTSEGAATKDGTAVKEGTAVKYSWFLFSIIGYDKYTYTELSIEDFLSNGYRDLNISCNRDTSIVGYEKIYASIFDPEEPYVISNALHFKSNNLYKIIKKHLSVDFGLMILRTDIFVKGFSTITRQYSETALIDHQKIIDQSLVMKYVYNVKKFITELAEVGYADVSILTEITNTILDETNTFSGIAYIRPLKFNINDNSEIVKSEIAKSSLRSAEQRDGNYLSQ